jgi:hypothetical protein
MEHRRKLGGFEQVVVVKEADQLSRGIVNPEPNIFAHWCRFGQDGFESAIGC